MATVILNSSQLEALNNFYKNLKNLAGINQSFIPDDYGENIGRLLAGTMNFAVVTTAERNALIPEEGAVVWNSDDVELQVYNGSSWNTVGASLGNFVFSGNSVDLNAAATLTIGGANTSSIAFNISGVSAGDLNGAGGNVALRAPSTFKYAGIEADEGAGYVRCGSATGTVAAFGDNRITFADNITLNLTNVADRSIIFTEADVEFGRIKEDGSGGMHIQGVTGEKVQLVSPDGIARVSVQDNLAQMLAQNGLDRIQVQNGEVDIIVNNTNCIIALGAQTIYYGGAGVERMRIDGTGIGFFGATPVAKPTGVAVDVAAIHAALVSLGLIEA